MIANRLRLDDDDFDDRPHRGGRPMFSIEDEGTEAVVSVQVWPVLLAGTFAAGVVVGAVLAMLMC